MAGEHVENVRIRLEIDDIIRTTSGRGGPGQPGQPGNRRPNPSAPDSGGTRPTQGRRGAGRARTVGAELLGAGVAGAAADAIAGTDATAEDFVRQSSGSQRRQVVSAAVGAKSGLTALPSASNLWARLSKNPVIAIGTAYAGASVLSHIADRSIEIMRGNVSPFRAAVGAINEQTLEAAENLVKFSATNPLSTLIRQSLHGFSKTSDELNTAYDASFKRGAFALGNVGYQFLRATLAVLSLGALPPGGDPGFIKEARAAAEADVTKRYAAETVQQQAASLSILYRLGIPTDITAGLLRKHADLQHKEMIAAATAAMNRAAKGLNPE